MSISDQRRMAEELYESGQALFRRSLFIEALRDLNRAADIFRKLDAEGHAFPNPLSNGLSGLANCLFISGHCRRQLGEYSSAITCYESSLINAKFEKKKAFRVFVEQLSADLAFCYEKIVETVPQEERSELMDRETGIDMSFRFPYSLPAEVIPYARLYELAPQRYAQYKNFYDRAGRKDSDIRRLKTSDSFILKKTSIYVWSILFVIWAVYGAIVINAMMSRK